MPEDFNNIKAKAQKALNIEKNELTFVSKFFYGFAGMPYQMFFTAISVFTSVFLLEKAEISSANVSVILFISRYYKSLLKKRNGKPILKYILINNWNQISKIY